MNKGYLNNDEKTPILWFRMEIRIKLSVFAKAITDYFYNYGGFFPDKLTKKEAERILKRQVYNYGTSGETPDRQFEASFEEGERYNSIYDSAIKWVNTNHPHLNKKP